MKKDLIGLDIGAKMESLYWRRKTLVAPQRQQNSFANRHPGNNLHSSVKRTAVFGRKGFLAVLCKS
jgi:hypothetical protein